MDRRRFRPDEIGLLYCPVCGAEYRRGTTHCADCQVELVAERPAERGGPPKEARLDEGLEPYARDDLADCARRSEGREPVTIHVEGDLGTLGLASSLLEAAGIPYHVPGDSSALGRLGSGYNPAAGGFRLIVPAGCEEQAREILAQLR
jgi:hypothetical protein